MAQRLVYPAIFDPTAILNHVQITMPDVPGVKVLGTSNEDAANKAATAAGKLLIKLKDELPVPSTPNELDVKPGQSVSFIVLDLDDFK